MELFRVSKQREKGAIDRNRISSFALVTVNYKNINAKSYEVWFKTNGNDNPWNCAIAEKVKYVGTKLPISVDEDTYATGLNLDRDILLDLIEDIIKGKYFLVELGQRVYAENSKHRTYLIDEIYIEKDHIVKDYEKEPYKFFEHLIIEFNPFDFALSGSILARPILNKDLLMPVTICLPINANPTNILYDSLFSKYEELDLKTVEKLTYKRNPLGLYYCEISTDKETHKLLNYSVTDSNIMNIEMFTDLREMDDIIDSIYVGEMKLVKFEVYICKSDETKFIEYIKEFEEYHYKNNVRTDSVGKKDEIKAKEEFILERKKICKLYFKEYKNNEGIKYRLFVQLTNTKDNKFIYIPIGNFYNDSDDMRLDIKKFIDGDLNITLTKISNSEFTARFTPTTIESDYKEIDLNDFR